MPSKNKLPSDAYSADAFRGHLDALDRAGVEYVPPSSGRDQDESWAVVFAVLNDEERALVRRLDQLYVNAGREAEKENEERDMRKLLPPVLKAIRALEEDAQKTIVHLGSATGRVAYVARDFLSEAEHARKQLEDGTSARVKPSEVGEIYGALREAYSELKRIAGATTAQNRFGKDNDDFRQDQRS